MKLYPWLIKTYEYIIQQHQKKTAHHAILIKTPKGIGTSRLIWFVSKWLLCLKPTGISFCNNCHGCKLISTKNHPDYHEFICEKNNIFNVNNVRTINEKVFKHSQQGGNKVIFLSNTEKLSESAINAFLKTLEEPPKKTWFFLINYNHSKLSSTLSSRCLIYKLFVPLEKDSLNWLKSENLTKNRSHLTALRINQGSPILARKLLKSESWTDRINLYKSLFDALKNKDLLKIRPIFNHKTTIVQIDWICLLLLDSIKFNYQEKKFLINYDQIKLIHFFSSNYAISILDTSIRHWMLCRHRLLNISGINHELLILEQLLSWEKILNFNFTN